MIYPLIKNPPLPGLTNCGWDYPQQNILLLKRIAFFVYSRLIDNRSATLIFIYYFSEHGTMVGRSSGNKQVDKNAAKEKSSDSSKHKKKAQRRHNLGGGGARGKSKRQQ